MAVLAQDVLGDQFEVGQLSFLAFKIYICTQSDDRLGLRRAMTTLYCDHLDTALATIAGNELWVFSPQVVPRNLEPARIELAGEGSISLSKHSPRVSDEARIIDNFLSAVQTRTLVHLTSKCPHYILFGSSLYSSLDGSLLHIIPSLSHHGELYLRLTVEKSGLTPVNGQSPKTIWMLPSGRQARAIDGEHAPSQPLARQLHSLLRSAYYFNQRALSLEDSPWIQVSLDGIDILWPAALAVAGRQGEQSLSWLRGTDPYTTLAQSMSIIKTEMSNKSSKGNQQGTLDTKGMPTESGEPALIGGQQRQGHAPPPPPPTPSVGSNTLAPEHAVYPTPTDKSPERATYADLWSTPAGTGENWAEECAEDEVTVADFNYFDMDPAESSEPRVSVSQYHPLPGSFSPSTPAVQQPLTQSPGRKIDEKRAPLAKHPMYRRKPGNNAMQSSESFSPVDFVGESAVLLDSKYSTGGRYFMTCSPEDHEQSEPGHKDEPELSLQPEAASLDVGSDSDEEMEDFSDSDTLDSEYGDLLFYSGDRPSTQIGTVIQETDQAMTRQVNTGDTPATQPCVEDEAEDSRPYGRKGYPAYISQKSNYKKLLNSMHAALGRETDDNFTAVAGAWIDALTSTKSVYPGDFISSDNIQYLMAQIVWDNGMLRQLGDGPLASSALEPASGVDVKLIRQIYPHIKRVSLADLSSATSSMSTVSTPVASVPAFSDAGDSTARSESPQVKACSNPVAQKLLEGQPRSRSPAQGAPKEPSFTLLSPPLYTFTRKDQPHKARASILRLWKVFGLQPNHGPKDISVIYMTLASKRVIQGTSQFLSFLKSTYEGCNLGKMELPSFGIVSQGILDITADLEYTSPNTIGEIFETLCAHLKMQLTSTPIQNLIVFMAYPGGQWTSPLPLARGFLALRTAFTNVRWLLASTESFASPNGVDMLPSQYQMVRLSLLLYDRWVSRLNIKNAVGSYPAFSLARLVPHNISIKYAQVAPSQIFDDDPLMHVSYAVTEDCRWVSVAWSDQWASTTKVEVFRLAGYSRTRANSPIVSAAQSPAAQDSGVGSLREGTSSSSWQTNLTLQNMAKTFRDIWKRTCSLCSSASTNAQSSKWKVGIVKNGPMNPDEHLMWRKAAGAGCGEENVEPYLYLLSVPYSRPLNVAGGPKLFSSEPVQPDSPDGSGISGAEESAPQDSQSPISTPASKSTTPLQPSEQRSWNDRVIVSALDETQGIVFESKLFELHSMTTVLASGVLIKPLALPGNQQGHQQFEVDLVHTSGDAKHMMKQVIGQYRRLASLAEYTGVTTETTIVPWHIEATNKMNRALATI